MTRCEKIQWLVDNLDLYPLAKTEELFFQKMTDEHLDSLMRIERKKINGTLGKTEVQVMVNIIRYYQKGTEGYHRPWRQWIDNYELLN